MPPVGARERMRGRLLRQIALRIPLEHVREQIHPREDVRSRIWQHISQRLSLPVSALPLHARAIRLVAAFALVLFVVRWSPLLFLASPSRADSPVLLVPMKGEVSVLVAGLWEPVQKEVQLRGSAQVRTGDGGAATIIVHDDGVLRLDGSTTLQVQDLSDRPRIASDGPSFTLDGGRLWVQGLIPAAVGPGWEIQTPFGGVMVNEGSVSLFLEAKRADVAVWDRLARVFTGKNDATLVAGEAVRLSAAGLSAVRHTMPKEEEDSWVSLNLQRDAVHRREIALLQQERRAASAGILPTSGLYPVKRVAEAVDMLFTFGQEARTQKLLDQASTRLDEAAALLQQSGSGAAAAEQPLREFRQTLLSVASGSGGDAVVRSLVQQQAIAEVADVAAALPDDQSYLLKKTVLETTASLPGSAVKPEDVQGAILLDTLASLTRQAAEGDVAGAQEGFRQLLPSLSLTGETSPLPKDERKEARAALMLFAQTLREEVQAGSGGSIAEDLRSSLPGEVPQKPVVRSLTDDEVDALVQQMYRRIFSFKMPRSRYNQLLAEFHAIEGHPDQGRILRRLYHVLPENGLAKYVRTEFQKVREEVQKEEE